MPPSIAAPPGLVIDRKILIFKRIKYLLLNLRTPRPRPPVSGPASNGRAPELLSRHRDSQRFFRRDEVIVALSILRDGQLNAFDAARKLIAARPVVRRNRRSGVDSHIASIISGKDHGRSGADLAFADLFAVHVQGRRAALAESPAIVLELHSHLMITWRQRAR